ncbi:hypothetical protein K491DRAFT_586266 [Lophiostoma macrostomum CBS 122681]|uniref:Heterokaryon incompatibility domain-containing protein n=1 Tax=Lophiostoma macrostomum CBS 122681 TaxID=1314788 RepID=A0A6A6TPF3_9PLEO|nr:hypothetical protein K491DRAFT_586266 [Lophiostoma macrostomum CBS 122681]
MLELGVSVTAHDNHRNLVTIAAEAGHTSIINVLIEAGAELDGGTGRWGFTPLQNAVKGGHIDTAQFLIAAGADINLAGGRSEPPLHIAAKAKNANMFKLLLDADADIYLVSYTRKTVRQLVEKSGNEEIVRLLTEKESQVSAPAPNPDDEPFDVGDVEETIFCSECKKLPVTAFLGHNGYDFHPSLVSLRNAARSGCPFCMFFWKRIGVQTITIPQPSVCKIYQNGHSSSVWSQIEEPYPRDIECPEGLRADFTVDLEPFEDKRRPLSGDTRSPATYHQIQTWLEECCQSHSKCGNNSEATFRPSRLLDLSQWNIDRTIKLVDRKTLFESSPYVTLSYRRLAEVLASTITTSHNIASRYTSIASESLPLGFVHAIEVTLALNINYLWIDCLCIIQDSPDDWTYESSLLGKVYQNSFLTITSSASDNISEGLFRTFDTSNDCVEIPCISDLGTGETKLVRAMKHHRTWEQDYGASHLSKRGWAFQERELATEVSPTKKQLTATNSRLLDALSTATNDDDIYTLWYRTIKDYTSRHLTHETDKFPALASLAEIFATHTKSNYIAGIWEADLLHGISWIASDQYSTPRRPAARASGAYIAPTWSWASIVGSTCYKPPSAITREVQRERKPGMAVIRSHALTLETASPFGPVASASLHLCAPMITGVLGYDASSNWLGRIIQLRDLTGEEILGDMHFDVPAERGDQDIKVVRCIYLYTETLSSSRAGTSQDNECGFGLALVPVEGMVKTYRRIGPVQGLRLKYMRDVGAEEITIV